MPCDVKTRTVRGAECLSISFLEAVPFEEDGRSASEILKHAKKGD